LTSALLGLQHSFGLKNLSSHLSHLREDGQRGAGDTTEVGYLQDALNNTFAPIEERLDDEVMVHGGPPDAKVACLGFHQDTLWTTDRQFKGTPHEEVPAQMMRWNRARGKVLKGPERRREADVRSPG
jgi:hypothetical protein